MFGQVEWTQRGSFKRDFVGTLGGDQLTYGDTRLVIGGDRMSGTRTNLPNYSRGINIELWKAK